MSVQTDCEMLSVEAMEAYAGKYNLTGDEVSKLFHENQVFEKIDFKKLHNRRDFGKGFYTTVLQSQAKEWAYRLSLREKKNQYYVYEFFFEEVSALKVKRFDRYK